MPMTDPRIDAYIAKSPAFAQPILRHLRRVVHDACPDVTETIKWGTPTRARRVATALEWMTEGKSRNWKCGKR